MTRGKLRTLIRKRLGETTSAFWTDAQLNTWIDDAGHDIAELTKCIKDNGYITTVADQQEYTLSASFPTYLSVYEVYMYDDGATWEKLTQTSRDRLSREVPGWKSGNSSTPMKYYWDKEEDVLGLWPKPNSTNAGADYLQVYYAKDYTPMTQDTETPTGLSALLQNAMADYVVAIGYETRGWGDKANDAWSKYYSKIQRYLIDIDTEKQVDEEGIQMVNYRNI